MSDLLKESIADAKAVRETALANAKTFLEENFAASMKEMFAEKLKEEMADEATTEEGKIEEKLGSSNIGKDDSNVASKQHPTKPSPVSNKNTTQPGKQEFDAKLEEVSVEEGAEVTSAELDEILAELEAEETSPAPAAVAAPAAEVPPAPAPAPAPGQVPSPVAEAAEDDVTSEEMAEALVAINEENETLKKQLSEALSTVKFMKGVLAETNLLNAKLLYTNKLFKGKSLNEDQKLKIINTFDLTKNIREVKLAYTVLAESLNSGASVVKKKTNTTAQTITEGLASKPVSSTKPDSTIVEPQAEVMASRFQKLAGIKK